MEKNGNYEEKNEDKEKKEKKRGDEKGEFSEEEYH